MWRALRLINRYRAVADLAGGLDAELTPRVWDEFGYPLTVAWALVGRPALLILELTSVGTALGAAALSAIRATHETTVLAITRHPHLLAVTHNVIYIDAEGNAVTGTHRALQTKHPSYAALFKPAPPPAAHCSANRRRATPAIAPLHWTPAASRCYAPTDRPPATVPLFLVRPDGQPWHPNPVSRRFAPASPTSHCHWSGCKTYGTAPPPSPSPPASASASVPGHPKPTSDVVGAHLDREIRPYCFPATTAIAAIKGICIKFGERLALGNLARCLGAPPLAHHSVPYGALYR